MEETILSNGLSSSLQLREREAASRQNNQCEKFQAEGLVDDRDDGSGAGDDDGDGDGEGLDDDPEVNYRDPPEGYLRLRPSQFHHIPATVFVEYPPELGLTRNDISHLERLGRRKLHYVCYWGRNCVKNAFRRAGFLDDATNWTATWSKHQPPEVLSSLNCLQKVNHFPGSWCIGRKDRLMRTIQGMKRIHGEAVYGFHPEGFVLPGDSDQLERAIQGMSSAKKQPPLWIMKPVASSCGRGIKVITTDKALSIAKTKKKVLIQRYLANPYLINGKKFDLRIYVLVTGTDPLRVYIHKEGLTRISTDDYSLKNTKNKFAHLTNYSVNKKAPHFVTASEDNLTQALSSSSPPNIPSLDSSSLPSSGPAAPTESEMEGFKWSLKAFKQWLSSREGPEKCERVWRQIDDVILKTIIAAEPELTHSIQTAVNYRTNCSELFGFDIFLDQSLTPHLIEVNISPSLMGSSPLDRRIKGTLLADYCHVTGFYPHDPQLLSRYSSSSSSSSVSNKANPFSLLSLSRDMGQQDKWRKEPAVQNIDMAALVGDSCWMMLCMCEDEFKRAESSFFRLVHPSPATLNTHLPLYKQPRFSDHLLSRYLSDGMSQGKKNLRYLPTRFIAPSPKSRPQNGSPVEAVTSERSGRPPLHSRQSSFPPSPSSSRSPSSDRKGRRSHSTGPGRSTPRERRDLSVPRAAGGGARQRSARNETKKNVLTSSLGQEQRERAERENIRRRCTSAPRRRSGSGGDRSSQENRSHHPSNGNGDQRERKSPRNDEEQRERYPSVRKESSRGNRPSSAESSAIPLSAAPPIVGTSSRGELRPSIDQKYLPIGALRNKAQYSQYARHLHPPPPEAITLPPSLTTVPLPFPNREGSVKASELGGVESVSSPRQQPQQQQGSERQVPSSPAISQSSRLAGFRVLTYGSIGLPTNSHPLPPERLGCSPLSPRILQQKEGTEPNRERGGGGGGERRGSRPSSASGLGSREGGRRVISTPPSAV